MVAGRPSLQGHAGRGSTGDRDVPSQKVPLYLEVHEDVCIRIHVSVPDGVRG